MILILIKFKVQFFKLVTIYNSNDIVYYIFIYLIKQHI